MSDFPKYMADFIGLSDKQLQQINQYNNQDEMMKFITEVKIGEYEKMIKWLEINKDMEEFQTFIKYITAKIKSQIK